MSRPSAPMGGGRRQLRAWLEYVAQAAIDLLDEMDAAGEDLEDDEIEVVGEAPVCERRSHALFRSGGRR